MKKKKKQISKTASLADLQIAISYLIPRENFEQICLYFTAEEIKFQVSYANW